MINKGIYPTMITPYKNGEIDFKAVRRLVGWYIDNGCHGIFAVCQSSEMQFLSLKERVKLAETVVDEAAGRINIVASGHCSDSSDAQTEEANEISKTGIDAFVLVSNRLDLHNNGDIIFRENGNRLLDRINPDIKLGIYECPRPYKRLLSEDNLDWCISTGRFEFIKDTCCDPVTLKKRGERLKNTGVMLFNANEQTFLYSLKNGAAGYSGIMANFHPQLLCWLFENYEKEPEKAERLSNILSMTAFTENPAYPGTAKYHLNKCGVEMELFSRSADQKLLTDYQSLVMDQLYELNNELIAYIGGK